MHPVIGVTSMLGAQHDKNSFTPLLLERTVIDNSPFTGGPPYLLTKSGLDAIGGNEQLFGIRLRRHDWLQDIQCSFIFTNYLLDNLLDE